jgi:hypothetical protein
VSTPFLIVSSAAVTTAPARDAWSLALDLRPTSPDDRRIEVALSNYLNAWSSRLQIFADFYRGGGGFNVMALMKKAETEKNFNCWE